MSCWSLWQRMPPRYQLTMRDIRADDQDLPRGGNSSRAPSATKPQSPKTPRGTQAEGSPRERESGEGGMMNTTASSRGPVLVDGSPSEGQPSPQSPVLPSRSSAYVHNMKNQLRINKTRRKIDEGTLELTSPTTYTPKPRATTAPAFPITNPSNTDQYHRFTNPIVDPMSIPNLHDISSTPGHQHLPEPQRGFSGRKTSKRSSGGRGGVTKQRIPVNTVCPFEELTELSTDGPTSPFRASPVQQDCVIGDYQMAALYMDKGRVTFFRKTKPDVTQSVYSAMSPYNVTRGDGSYLSHLRKAYLSGVRDLPKLAHKEPEMEKHITIRERMDYDRKVGRILDYYTKVEVRRGLLSPCPIPDVQQSLPTSPFPAAQHAFRTFGARKVLPKTNTVSEFGESNPYNRGTESDALQATPRGSPVPRAQDQLRLPVLGSGDFVRINARAPLHHRHHFYLRTPAGLSRMAGKNLQQDSGCVCAMCHLEMDVALMAQLHQDLGVSVDAETAAQIRSNLEKGAVNVNPDQTPQARADGAHGVDNSSAQGTNAPSTAAGQHPNSGATANAAQIRPVQETTSCLTVTLPAIEEINDVTHTVEDSEVNMDNAAATTDQKAPVSDTDPETSDTITIKDSVQNSEQETPETVKASTAGEEPTSDGDCAQGPVTDTTEAAGTDLRSKSESDMHQLSVSIHFGSPERSDTDADAQDNVTMQSEDAEHLTPENSKPDADVKENVTRQSDAAEANSTTPEESHPLDDVKENVTRQDDDTGPDSRPEDT